MHQHPNRRAFIAGSSATLLLAGCGGGGGSSPTPSPAPTPTPTSTPSANIAIASETWTSNPPYIALNDAIISGSDSVLASIDGRNVRLRGVHLPRVGSAIAYGAGAFPVGATLMVSFYVQGNSEGFFWPRYQPHPAHEPKLYTASPRRVWWVARATSASEIALVTNPHVALTSTPGSRPTLLYHAGFSSDPVSVYAGGLQIEVITAGPQGIALIGDSTQTGEESRADILTSTEPSKWLSGLLNVPIFNRAYPGDTTDRMLARWDGDIAPLAVNSRYAIIQGGINDIKLGRQLTAIMADINGMASRATQNGMLPVVVTATPNTLSNDNQTRVALNDWIRSAFPRVIDLDAAMRDPSDHSRLRADLTYDGTHYTAAGRRLAGQFMSERSFWEFAKPSPYVPSS